MLRTTIFRSPNLSKFVRHGSTSMYSAAVTTLKKDLKQAMLAKDDIRKTTIRSLLSTIKNKEIDNNGKDFDEFMLFDTYSKLVSQRRDSIGEFLANGREDLVSKERQEMEIIQTYLEALPVSSKEEIDAKTLDFLKKLKETDPNLQMKQVFGKMDLKKISSEWKTSPNVLKTSIATQFKKIF